MGYIGNEPTTGHFPVQTNLVGAPSGSYTLDRAPASAGAIEVSVQGVLQPTTAYSVSGTTLTMAGVTTGIPIFIRYLGETLTLPTIADGVVVEGKIGAGAVTDGKLAASGTMPAWNGAALTGITHTPAADSVDGTKIADNAIDSEHYTDGSIDNIHTNFQPGTTFKGDGASARGKIVLNCEQNTHGVSIQSPAHASAANYTLTLPPNDGTADQVLKTDGSGVLSFADAGGGAWEQLTTTGLMTSTSSFTVSSTYITTAHRSYAFRCNDLYLTSGGSPHFRFSANNGSSYYTGGSDYSYVTTVSSHTSHYWEGDLNHNYMSVMGGRNVTSCPHSGWIYLWNPLESGRWTSMTWMIGNTGTGGGNDQNHITGHGYFKTTAAINNVLLTPGTSGTWIGGEITFFGLTHS